MHEVQPSRAFLAIIVGLLAATSNSWLFHPTHAASQYEAPWVYPGEMPQNR